MDFTVQMDAERILAFIQVKGWLALSHFVFLGAAASNPSISMQLYLFNAIVLSPKILKVKSQQFPGGMYQGIWPFTCRLFWFLYNDAPLAHSPPNNKRTLVWDFTYTQNAKSADIFLGFFDKE